MVRDNIFIRNPARAMRQYICPFCELSETQSLYYKKIELSRLRVRFLKTVLEKRDAIMTRPSHDTWFMSSACRKRGQRRLPTFYLSVVFSLISRNTFKYVIRLCLCPLSWYRTFNVGGGVTGLNTCLASDHRSFCNTVEGIETVNWWKN